MSIKNKTVLALLTITMVVTVGFFSCGCIEDTSDSEIDTSFLKPFELKNKTLQISSPYEIALSTPVVLNRGISLVYTEDCNQVSNPSLFSARLALTFWESPARAYLVDSYEGALIAASIAKMDDCPILWYGNATSTAIKFLNPVDIVGIKLADGHNCTVVLMDDTFILDFCQSNGLPLSGYVGVVNLDAPDPATYAAPLLTAYRNGIIKAVFSDNISEIRDNLIEFGKKLNSITGIPSQYISLFGGADSIPHHITPLTLTDILGQSLDIIIYSDNYLACTNTSSESFAIPDVAIGRIVSTNVTSSLNLCMSYVHYDEFCASNEPENAVLFSENVEAEAVSALCPYISMINLNKLFIFAGYQTYTSNSLSSTTFAQILSDKLSSADIIYSVFVSPETFLGVDSFNNAVIFDSSGIHANNNSNLQHHLLGSGSNTYIGSVGYFDAGVSLIRIGGSYSDPISAAEEGGTPLLAKHFFNTLLNNDSSVGIALRNAKNSYCSDINQPPGTTEHVSLACVIYGDPAFNPYEPCNEGTNYGS